MITIISMVIIAKYIARGYQKIPKNISVSLVPRKI